MILMLESLFKGSFDHGNGSNSLKTPKLDILVDVRPKIKFTRAITQLSGPALGVTGTSSGVNRPELMLREPEFEPENCRFLFFVSFIRFRPRLGTIQPRPSQEQPQGVETRSIPSNARIER